MLVCWEWLKDYVDLPVSPDEMALKFAMSGLNHESTEHIGSDIVIDLEVTSNRGDCLGHIGVAREAAVLQALPLKIPEVSLQESTRAARDSIQVENRFEAGCPEYTARIIRGVKIGASPDWLVRRLKSIGIESVNNVVDITNFVMMECGQPLHAFDLQEIRGNKIIVRPALPKEQFVAIDHKTYELDEQMVVIADSERAVALGGVMGGLDSEISSTTTDLLIESARFTPLAIRRAARKLKLHSPASYRFERTTDPAGADWASQRCCDLILQLCGGELESGIVRDGVEPSTNQAIELRFARVSKLLGIDIPGEECRRILSSLGCQEQSFGPESLVVIPPSWRTDLLRECDLIEEVARIYGYEQIPEDVAVPIGVASPRPKDVALERARLSLSAYGVDEAMTASVVAESFDGLGSLWCKHAALTLDAPLLKGSKLLRRALIPSLLDARHFNQTQAIRNAELFEVATIFLPESEGGLPVEQSTLGIVTAGDLQRMKGIVESIVREVAGYVEQQWKATDHAMMQTESAQSLTVADKRLAYVGLTSKSAQERFSLDQTAAIAEVNVDVLTDLLVPVRRAVRVSPFPAVERDLNFIVEESRLWAEIESTVRKNASDSLETVEYRETYRDQKKDGKGKKRILLTLRFRSQDKTLTGQEVDASVQAIVQACQKDLSAQLLG